MGHFLAHTRLIQVYVLHKVPAKSSPTRLLDVQEHHHVGGAHVELETVFSLLDVLVVHKV